MNKYFFPALLMLSAQVWSQTPDTSNPYIRKPRKAAVGIEVGMNSLGSLAGITGTFFVKPRIAVDVGLAVLTVTGLRPGVRGRYMFSDGKFTGFAYGGLKYGLGSGNRDVELKDVDDNTKTIRLKIKPSPYADLGLGMDYLAHNGFYFTGTLGWSFLLGGKNYEWTGGVITQNDDKFAKFMLNGGPALALGLGYAF